MSDNVIWSVDFRARREREVAELEVASEALKDCGMVMTSESLIEFERRIHAEVNPQDSA